MSCPRRPRSAPIKVPVQTALTAPPRRQDWAAVAPTHGVVVSELPGAFSASHNTTCSFFAGAEKLERRNLEANGVVAPRGLDTVDMPHALISRSQPCSKPLIAPLTLLGYYKRCIGPLRVQPAASGAHGETIWLLAKSEKAGYAHPNFLGLPDGGLFRFAATQSTNTGSQEVRRTYSTLQQLQCVTGTEHIYARELGRGQST